MIIIYKIGVYPRVGGGTAGLRVDRPDQGGLSPRGRGNHLQSDTREGRPGSIPAWAGEPTSSRPDPAKAGVYPRVGGGTSTSVSNRFVT